LEKWRTEAITSGTRALDQLRLGVQTAITTLGTGFLRHPANRELRETLEVTTFHNALLRMVYRLLFLFVAEDRDALLLPDANELAKKRFHSYFSTARLRQQAQRRRRTAHGDLYAALRILLDGLGHEDGVPELGLPGLGGLFDDTETDRVLHGLTVSNEALLAAVRALSVVRDQGAKRNRAVDYRHLGAEELGSIYESLLELVPKHDAAERTFELVELAGNTRKTTGSYYTPSSLIDCLLDSALEPVIDGAVKRGEVLAATKEQADPFDAIVNELLSLTICDPACGSGHFLVAAARRIAKRIAAVRERNPEPTLDAVRAALHEVVARCIYGVDLNPMAVELAKVSLWLEALEPGKPLGFLDAHLKHGNALIGVTPALLTAGIPDDAFKPIEGDDKRFAAALRKINANERVGQRGIFDDAEDSAIVSNTAFAQEFRTITSAPSGTLREVRLQSSRYRRLEQSSDYLKALHIADAWCAAFVWMKTMDAPRAVTEGIFRDLQNPDSGVPNSTHEEIIRLREQYRFFHWHLEFPEVFDVSAREADHVDSKVGWTGGFSCVLGNPPWERVKLQEQEFFAALHEGIAKAPNKAARERMIKSLETSGVPGEGELLQLFAEAKRVAEGISQLLRNSNRYPLTGRGDVNTYAVFAETASLAIGPDGQFGLVLPTGIATDATTAPFFSDLVRGRRLVSFLDFENEAFILSRDVHHTVRFCLLTVAGLAAQVQEASFAFGTRYMADLAERRFAMPPEEILLVNPNSGTLPVFRSRRDAEIILGIYRRVPVLLREEDPKGNPWGLTFGTMFHMSNDSYLFRTREQLEAEPPTPGTGATWQLDGNVFLRDEQRMLPLYEAKMLHQFDHRLGTYDGQTEAQANMGTLPRLTQEQHDDPDFVPMPRYWVPEFDVPTEKRDAKGKQVWAAGVASRMSEKSWHHDWFMGWRNISHSGNERTMISSFPPLSAVGHSTPLVFPARACEAPLLQACFASLVLDYVLRQKIAGSNLTFGYLYQLPVPNPQAMLAGDSYFDVWDGQRITASVLELVYNAHDMTPFARDLGDTGAPFRWDDSRRALLRAELDAALFHLYGVARDDVDHIMDTFPTLRRKDEVANGSFRTKELVLGMYDRMAEAARTSVPYQTMISPPPGHGPRHLARAGGRG
jgi:hypothetical protein